MSIIISGKDNDNVEHILKRLSDLEETCWGIQKQFQHVQWDVRACQKENLKLEKKIMKLNRRNEIFVDEETRLNREMQTLKTKTEQMENHLNQLSGLQKALNRTLVGAQRVLDLDSKVDYLAGRMDSIENKTEFIENRTDSLENTVDSIQSRFGCISQSVTRAVISPRGRLATGQFVKLDKCSGSGSSGNCSLMDETSGCMVPQWNGDYVLGVICAQAGEGAIRFYLKWDKSEGNGYYIGMTAQRNDVCSFLDVRRLSKGQKVWVVAEQIRGEPRISWCVFTCWLLSPL